MNKKRTRYSIQREAGELMERFYKDFDAFESSCSDYNPGVVMGDMIMHVFNLASRKLGREGAEELFAAYGPRSKRWAQGFRKERLALYYGMAGKPSAKTGKYSMAAFARDAARENGRLSGIMKLGTGTTDPDNMLRDLKRMLKQKKYKEIADHAFARYGGFGKRWPESFVGTSSK
jgi:hypothetical protein